MIRVLVPLLVVLIAGSAACAAPQIIWHTQSVRPDQTVLAFGEGFDPANTKCVVLPLPELERDQIPDTFSRRASPLETPPGSAKVRDAVFVSARRAGFTLPGRREDDRLYVLWFGAPGDWSRPLLVNRPKILYVTPSVVAPGAPLRFFGENLGGWPRYNSKKRRYERYCWVLFTDPQDNVVKQLMGYASSNYELTINVPNDLEPRDYRVYIHGTRGGAHGWSDAVEIRVQATEPWPDRRIDARTAGVVGDGFADDTDALQQVMDDCAKAGGGTVRLAAGTFLISDTLHIPPGVWLRGAGMDSTRIQFDTSVPFAHGKQRAVVRGTTRFRLSDLSVLSGPATVRGLVISNDDGPAEDCLIQRCRFKALVTQDTPWNQGVLFNLPWSMPKHPILNCEISDCEIEATYSIFLSSAKRCRVLRNRLVHTQMPMACWSMAECLVEGNRFVPGGLRETSAHGPMLMAKTGYFGGVVGNVFRANVGGHHGPGTAGPRNVGEAFAFDCLANVEKAVVRAPVAGASADSITFAEAEVQPDALRDMTAFIISGKGVGQVRVVTGNDATTATVARDWSIVPDETSMLCITRTFRGNMILRNMFSDAGSCFIWGRGFHNIFALNQLDDVGFLGAVGLSWKTDDRPNPCFFNEFNENWLNYRYARGGGAGVIAGNYRDAFAAPLPGPLCYGTILRANKITGGGEALKVALGGRDQFKHEGTLVWDTLFEGNELRQCKTGASICARAEGTMLRRNSMEEVETPLKDEGIDTMVLE